jgi:hypothetical protein
LGVRRRASDFGFKEFKIYVFVFHYLFFLTFHISIKTYFNKDQFYPYRRKAIRIFIERRLTGNGANRSLFGSGERPCVAGVQKGFGCRFRRLFFGSFFFRNKKEQKTLSLISNHKQ